MTAYLASLRGQLATASLNEIFVHTIAIESAADASVVSAMVMSSWQTAFATPGTGIQSLFANGAVTYTEATAAKIIGQETTGELGPAAHTPFNPPLTGGTAANSLPSQCAVAVSLTGGTKPNGAPMKGRFYLPAFHVGTLATDGTMLAAHQQKAAAGVQGFINVLNDAGHKVCIWSRRYGTMNQVSTVRVGNKFDTVRARRNKLPELYEVRSIAQ